MCRLPGSFPVVSRGGTRDRGRSPSLAVPCSGWRRPGRIRRLVDRPPACGAGSADEVSIARRLAPDPLCGYDRIFRDTGIGSQSRMSRKYFGTDGIRGRTNILPMTPVIAMRVGQAAGKRFLRGTHRHRVVIGKDTRLSGYMMESRSEEHTSELQSLMRISYAVFCL